MKKDGWAAAEFLHVNFGDQRLKDRLVKISDCFSELPESSINQSCEAWSQAKAAYRFFSNEKVEVSKMLASHVNNTVERAKSHQTILAVQDSSFLVYRNHRKTTGLGNIAKKKKSRSCETDSEGLVMHSSLALTTDGLPIGLLSQKIFARHSKDSTEKRRKHEIPVEEKESYRWIESLKESKQAIGEIELVTICDREADFYDFFKYSQDLGSPVLVRANINRVINKSSRYSEATGEKLETFLENLNSSGSFKIIIPSSIDKKSREASLTLKFGKFKLNSGRDNFRYRHGKLPLIEMTVIYVSEQKPPEGEASIDWILFTNLSVENFNQALEKVNWYCLRWRIEMFHKVLKSGFKIEYCRLATAERLKKYLTLMSIVAWRIFTVTLMQRTSPDLPCDSVLSEDEWMVLYLKTNGQKKLPMKPPKISQALRWIAQLGGYLARNGDGFPGTIVMWRGWKRLTDLTQGWKIAMRNNSYG